MHLPNVYVHRIIKGENYEKRIEVRSQVMFSSRWGRKTETKTKEIDRRRYAYFWLEVALFFNIQDVSACLVFL